MSWWTHIKGVVEVDVGGRTQAEVRYILESVLDHLPRVTGSEGDMNVYITQESGDNYSSSCDEFGMRTNNLKDCYGDKTYKHGFLSLQSKYMLTIDADLRDREFEETKREFLKWLCRLSSRVQVYSVVVKLWAYDQSLVITNPKPFDAMYDWKKPWTEYLRWERDPASDWPLKLADKYFDDKYIKDELKRREEWHDKIDREYE